MKLNPRKFNLEDFPEPPAWLGNLLSPLNQFIQESVQGTTNKITVNDNLYQEIKEIRFVNNSGNFPLSFKNKFPKMPIGITVIYCQATDGTQPSNTPWIQWNYSEQKTTITAVSNITSSLTYSIKLLIIYG